jgi:hypothetical protein
MSGLTLLIIRHAEKPQRDWPGPGLTIEGKHDDESLVIRSWQRAGSWSALFGTKLGGEDYPRPQVIYAANPSPQPAPSDPDVEVSQRPFGTITPLADRLGLDPVTKWSVGEELELVREITKLSGVVLVCWEHKLIISDMLPAIINGARVPGTPTKWDGARFDVVLRFDRADPTASWKFKQCFPKLMSGDSDQPLGH